MKKAPLIAIIFLGAILPLSAQKVSFGLQGSGLVSWFKTDNKNVDPEGASVGFGYGLIFDFNFADNYGLSTGLNVKSGAGGKLQYLDSIYFTDRNKGKGGLVLTDSFDTSPLVAYKIQYVEIPLALKLKTNEIGYMTYFGQFGFTPHIRWKGKGGATTAIEDISKIVEPLSVSLQVGGGFQYSLGGKTALLVGVIYENGLLDVTKDYVSYKKTTTGVIEDKVILNSVTLRAGVMF